MSADLFYFSFFFFFDILIDFGWSAFINEAALFRVMIWPFIQLLLSADSRREVRAYAGIPGYAFTGAA